MKNGEVKKQSKEEIKALLELVGGDEGTLLFLEEWLRNGRNAKRAYLKLHPDVTEQSAEVLGSRQLRKIKFDDVLAMYGLGIEAYIKQLKAGLEAIDKEGNPDHKVRRLYHQPLGEILGLEGRNQNINTQINIAAVWQGMAQGAKDRFKNVEELKDGTLIIEKP